MKSSIRTGAALAIASAVAFGVTTPVIAWAGLSAGPLTVASLLYAGASIAAMLMTLVGRASGTKLVKRDAARVVGIAIVGAAIAPACLAWGLSRAGAIADSLALNLEAIITVMLAWWIYREPIGRRVFVAVAIMAGAGALLVLDASSRGDAGVLGTLAVGAATLAWAIDNTLTRGLAERDPLRVIAAKGALGAVLTASIAVARGEPLPPTSSIAVLLACGATGYGLSLRFYLLAQRRIGAARTGSVFALAPFVGGAIAWLLGDRGATYLTALAAAGFGIGVYLHVSERHAHAHVHASLEHEHAHRHDDEHHQHEHDPPVAGEHTHRHAHNRVEHAHDHAPDVHHDHTH